ncbi:hypothetical protein RchiOBHm_Chr6g0251801 [Rosa chinensis]|uniref:Uncharacterized protein n=1 Tax=Rosa chinensis TaxID=74649 RepID=A0A2P6PKW4_ROSCH|nr:hypothetical protein RchiOBHm_Chr6g0251801 [Rosa chinensis]
MRLSFQFPKLNDNIELLCGTQGTSEEVKPLLILPPLRFCHFSFFFFPFSHFFLFCS